MAVSIKLCHATVVQHSPSLVSCLTDLGDEAALSMGIMLWAGILVVVFVLLLLAVDVTCYFVNKCGLIMCLCGKSGTGTKGNNLEEGKAAFMLVSSLTVTCNSGPNFLVEFSYILFSQKNAFKIAHECVNILIINEMNLCEVELALTNTENHQLTLQLPSALRLFIAAFQRLSFFFSFVSISLLSSVLCHTW